MCAKNGFNYFWHFMEVVNYKIFVDELKKFDPSKVPIKGFELPIKLSHVVVA